MSAALPLIIAFIAVLSSLACAQEVAYAHGESGGQPLESGNITAYNGTDLVTSAIPGAGPSLGGSGMTLEEMKREIALKLNVGNPRVRDEGMSLILEYPGDGTINQICSIYEHMVANWSYARDTRGREVLQYSNQSLDYGKGRFSGQGDCDDFAILLASLVESVGGTSRIILAYGPQGGHAYAEVYLGRAGGPESDVQRMLSWLKKNYKVEKINTHWDLKTDDVWLNLDWWKDPNTGRELTKHPGGPFFEAASQVPIHTREDVAPLPLKPLNDPPIAYFTVSPELPNAGGVTTFNASMSGDIGGEIVSYKWDFGDGNGTDKVSGPFADHIYLKGDTFVVILTVEDDEGAVNISSKEIMINNPPQARFSFYPLAPKPNETVTFDASQSKDIEDSTLRYNWAFGDGDNGIGIRKLHPYLLGGIYRVNLTVIDSNGAENYTFRELKVNRPPHAVIKYDKEEPNAGDIISFDPSDSTDDDGSIIGYFWDFGDGNTSEEKSPPHVYQEGGNFTVNLTVKDSDNATDTNITRIKINERPIAAFIFSPVNPNVNEEITFNASESNDPDGIDEYTWDFSEGKKPESWSEPIAYYSYHRKGIYDVILTVVDSKGAKNIKKERIDIGDSLILGSAEIAKEPGIIPHSLEEAVDTEDERILPSSVQIATSRKRVAKSTEDPVIAASQQAHDKIEIRGSVASENFTWTADSFPGFYYDIDDNIMTEELTVTVTGRKLLEPYGVVYNTTSMADDFDFENWGTYNVIGFLAEKYFAGYLDTPDSNDDILFEESDNENVLANKQLLKILMDSDNERTISSGTPLALEEGYELSIKFIDIDGNNVYLELLKDGSLVDSKVISPSAYNAGMKNKTYLYKKDIGDSKDVVIIAAHFKNAFRSSNQNLAIVDGLWQLSETATDVSENTVYENMTIRAASNNYIMMNNEDNEITLSNGKDISLMKGVSIRTADIDPEFEGEALRFYPYKEIKEAGTYEIRGRVATESATWSADEFAGFYYDIDRNIKTEELTTTVTDRKLLEPDGVVYTTAAMADNFGYGAWGEYLVIAFLGEKYFAGYLDIPDSTDDILFEESDHENVLVDEQLLKILIDDNNEMTVSSEMPLALKEGYELSMRSIDTNGCRIYLSKNGSVVDSRVMSQFSDKAGMKDKTYFYKKDLGDSKDVVVIAVHFKNIQWSSNKTQAIIDGLWQLSDTPTDVSEDTEYDKMIIQTVTSNEIMMNNEDYDISLSNGKDVSLMAGIRFKTADTSEDGGDVLRYYIYKTEVIA